MLDRLDIGRKGELLACEHLVDRGYKIIGRNIKIFKDEIDIVAKNQNGLLVFVEVKTMSSLTNGLKPEDNLTRAKLNKLRRSATMFAGKHQNLINDNLGWRIDLIAITLFNGKHSISHYENIC